MSNTPLPGLAQAKACLRNSHFNIRHWRERGNGVWDATLWVEGRVAGWEPRLWVVVPEVGRPAILPGFFNNGVWLWSRPESLRIGQVGNLRKEIAQKLKTMRNFLTVWRQTPVPIGAGEKIGPMVERRFAPWYSREVPHHGRVWQSREPMEYRGLNLLEAFDEIVMEEWQRRKLNNVFPITSAKAIAAFYWWYKSAWSLPDYLTLSAQKESQALWLYEKKPPPKPKLRKLSIISDEVAKRLKQERKEMRLARANNNQNSYTNL